MEKIEIIKKIIYKNNKKKDNTIITYLCDKCGKTYIQEIDKCKCFPSKNNDIFTYY